MWIITIIACLMAYTFGVLWLFASYERGRWINLERLQTRRLHELHEQMSELVNEKYEIDKFRDQPGMETVSDAYAGRFLQLEAENIKLTTECNALRLEVAKYMDLYRNERYKPRQK